MQHVLENKPREICFWCIAILQQVLRFIFLYTHPRLCIHEDACTLDPRCVSPSVHSFYFPFFVDTVLGYETTIRSPILPKIENFVAKWVAISSSSCCEAAGKSFNMLRPGGML
jgi:hypothetical protein